MNELEKLYRMMRAQGYLSDAVDIDKFSASLSDEGKQRQTYDFLAKQKVDNEEFGAAGMDWNEFSSTFFKKKVPTQSLGGTSETSGEQSGESQQNELTPNLDIRPDVLPVDASRAYTPSLNTFSKPAPEMLNLTGDEDVNSFGENLRKGKDASYEYRQKYDSRSDTRMAGRKANNAVEYGNLAGMQVSVANDEISFDFGNNWQEQYQNAIGIYETLKDNQTSPAQQQELRLATEYAQKIQSHPSYAKWVGGQKALQKGDVEYRANIENPGALAEMRYAAKQSQEQADKDYEESFWRPKRNFLLRKTGELIGSIASLPRTIAGVLPDDLKTKKWMPADALGAWGDEITESARMAYPKPTQLAVGVFEKVVDFEGKKVSVVNGMPEQIIDDKGKRTKPDEDFARKFVAAGAGKSPGIEYTGAAPLFDKVATAATDLLIMRLGGGGTKLGTAAASVALTHQDAYKSAIEQIGMEADDAAEYAATASLLNAAIEAYVGNIETAVGAPALATARAMGIKEAKQLAGKASASQVAWTAIKPIIKEVKGENAEEFMQSITGEFINQAYSGSGAQFKSEISPENIGETLLVTTLVTAPIAALGAKGYLAAARRSALGAAVQSPDKFRAVMSDLANQGVVDQQKADILSAKVDRLSAFSKNLPDGMTYDDRTRALAMQEYRDEMEAVSKNPNVVPAQQGQAKAAMKALDTEIKRLLDPETAAITEPDSPDGEDVEKTPLEQDIEAPESAPPFFEGGNEVNTEGPDYSVSSGMSLPESAVGLSTAMDVAEKARTDETMLAADFVPTVRSVLASRQIPDADISDKDIEGAISNGLFSGTSPYSDMNIEEAVDEIATDIARQKGLDTTVSAEGIEGAVASYFARGGKVNERHKTRKASSLYFSKYDPPIPDLAVDLAAQTGTSIDDAQQAIESFIKNNPERNIERFSRNLLTGGEDVAMSSEDIVAEQSRIEEALSAVAAEELQPLRALFQKFDNDPTRAAAAFDGTGSEADVQLANEYKNLNDGVDTIIQEQVEQIRPDTVLPQVAEGNVEEAGQAEEQAPIREIAESEGEPGEDVADAGLVRITSANPEAALVAMQSGLAEGDALSSVANEKQSPSFEAATQKMIAEAEKDAKEIANAADAARDGDTAEAFSETSNPLPGLITAETETEFVVVRSSGRRDLLRDAGGKFVYGRGWIFPLKDKAKVLAAMTRPSTPTRSQTNRFVGTGGIGGRLKTSFLNPFVHLADARRRHRIEKAKNLEEKIRIAEEEIGTDERVKKLNRALAVLPKAFPGIEIVTDLDEYLKVVTKMGWTTAPTSFIHEGKVYVNMSVAGPDAVMHEIGHLWAMATKEKSPALYARGVEILRRSEYEAAVREDPRYASMTDEEIIEEALALAVGERGARIMNASRWRRFMEWLDDMRSLVRSWLSRDPFHFTAVQYADAVVNEVLKGDVSGHTSQEIARLQGEKTRFMFTGEDADFEDDVKGALVAAKALEEKGYDNGAIWVATNWRRGIDGKWKYEISDSLAEVVIEPSLLEDEVMLVSNVLKHERLYSLYPSLANLPVVFASTPGYRAMLSTQGSGYFVIVDRNLSKEEIRLELLHEMQHVVQIAEGFGQGGTVENVSRLIEREISEILAKFETAENQDFERKRLRTLISSLGKAKSKIYNALSGEVEARNVANRASLAQEDIFGTPPESTEDVSAPEQIVLFGNEQANMAVPGFAQTGMEHRQAYDYAQDSIREAAMNSAANQIIEGEVRRGGDKAIAIAEVSRRLGIEEASVNRMWEDAEVRVGKGETLFDAREGKIAKSIEAIKAKFTRWSAKQFSYKGLLPKDIFETNKKRIGETSAILYRMNKLGGDLERAMKKEFGAVTEDTRRHIDAVLKGEADLNTLSPEMGAIVVSMRAEIDGLSKRLLLAGGLTRGQAIKVLDGIGVETSSDEYVDKVVTILTKAPYERTEDEIKAVDEFLKKHSEKFGTYLNRSYRVHDYPDWKERIPRDVMDRARRYIIGDLKGQADELIQAMAEFEGDGERKMAILRDRQAKSLAIAEKMIEDAINDYNVTTGANFVPDADAIIERAMQPTVLGAPQDDIDAQVAIFMSAGKDAVGAISRVRTTKKALLALEERLEKAKNNAMPKIDALHMRIKNVDDEIASLLVVDTDGGFGNVGTLGSKDSSILKARKNLSPEIRALLGEYLDPTVNFTKSAYKLANLITNQEFLNDMRSRYEGVYFFKDGNKPAGNYMQISSEGNKGMSPLAGYWTTPEIHEAMTTYYSKDEMSNWQRWFASRVVQAIKLGKTVLSPVTQARNFWGNTSFMVANGWNPAKMSEAFSEWMSEMRNGGDIEWRKRAENYARLGVIGESVNSGDIKDMMTNIEAGLEEDAAERFDSIVFGAGGLVRKPIAFVWEKAKFAYEAGDTFYRILGFENEKSRYAQAWFQKPFSALDAEQKKEVEAKAAKIINAVLPTYSYVPKIVKTIRAFPFTGTFVAFPSEMIRVTYNSYALAVEEMKDPRTAKFGVMRMLGNSAAIAGTYGVAMAMKSLLGYEDDEWENISEFMPDYKKNSQLIPVEKTPKGILRYTNLSYTDPYSWVKKAISAGSNGQGVADAAAKGLYSIVEPFAAPELTMNTAMQLRFNLDDRGNDIMVEALKDDVFGQYWLHPENMQRSLRFLAKKLQPGISKSIWDVMDIMNNRSDSAGQIKSWKNFLTSHAFGLQIETLDPTSVISLQLRTLDNQKRDSRAIFTSEQRRLNVAWNNLERNPGDESAESIAKAKAELEARAVDVLQSHYDLATEGYLNVLKDAHKKAISAQKLGIDKKIVEGLLKDANFSHKHGEIFAILSGNFDGVKLKFDKKGRF